MNLISNLKRFSLIAFFGLMTLSCSDDDENDSPENSLLVEAQSQTSLSTFVDALERAGLDGIFGSDTVMSVFAPTNTAFSTFLTENGYATLEQVPVDVLRELLLNHTLDGSIETSELFTGYRKTLARGMASETNYLDMYVDTSNGINLNGMANITTPNIATSNGMIHIVDHVIELPTVLSVVKANSELSTLKSALAYNPASGFEALLDGTGSDAPFTLFAPTDAAFASYFTETGQTVLAGYPEQDLETTLQFHIGTGSNSLSSGFFDNQSFPTLSNQFFTINLTGGGKKITDPQDRVSTMTKTDIQASNGVVHLIDKVLMPNL